MNLECYTSDCVSTTCPDPIPFTADCDRVNDYALMRKTTTTIVTPWPYRPDFLQRGDTVMMIMPVPVVITT
jgi:hypothetical protein